MMKAGLVALSLIAAGLMPAAAQTPKPDAQMQAVLDALRDLEAEPVRMLSVAAARSQASLADAARAVQRDRQISAAPEIDVRTADIAIPTAAGGLPARIYSPPGEGPFPVVIYFHGGGWVLADLNTYDATPRALALGTGALVLSVDYRHAPENRFPAAHDDAWAAYAWLLDNAAAIGGDPTRIAVAGESAGGNLAANVALMAKEKQAVLPVYQLLVYPVAGTGMDTPSYQENTSALPLASEDMEWFFGYVLADRTQASDPRLNLVGRDDLAGLPPATVVTAEIDPLRSEGQAYAGKLKAAGVAVKLIDVTGVTHEFFGMGKVVDKAKATLDAAAADLKQAFANSPH